MKSREMMKRSLAIKGRVDGVGSTQGPAITDQSGLFFAASIDERLVGLGSLSVDDNWNDQSHRCWKSRSRDRTNVPYAVDSFCVDHDLANFDSLWEERPRLYKCDRL